MKEKLDLTGKEEQVLQLLAQYLKRHCAFSMPAVNFIFWASFHHNLNLQATYRCIDRLIAKDVVQQGYRFDKSLSEEVLTISISRELEV